VKLEHRVSSYDFVRAMLLAGFRLTGTTMGYALIEKGDVRVFVPRSPVLPEHQIEHLLGEANVLPPLFMSLLHRLGSRDTVSARPSR